MSDNAREFNDRLARITAHLPEQTMLTVVRAMVMQAYRMVTTASPVGNPSLWKHPAPKGYVGGQFRGNWSLSIGFIPPVSKTPTGGTVSEAAITNPFQTFYLVNTLPYAMRLEHGWSTQAPGPAAIVGKTVVALKNANPQIF